VYDFSYVGKEGVEKNKLFFISWVPDVAKVKAKMLYASSKERFRRDLDGVQLEIQATDASEIEESVLRDKCTQVGQ
jgi:cofilin